MTRASIALAFSLSMVWGLFLLILGWCGISGWGEEAIVIISSLYLGFDSSFVGGILGGLWGILDGLIAGAMIGYLYYGFSKQKGNSMKINIKALALSLGITWGIAMLFLGWVGTFGWGDAAIAIVSSFYIGFEATFVGGIVGGCWGFIDGVIGGIILGVLYNSLIPRKKEPASKKQKPKRRAVR